LDEEATQIEGSQHDCSGPLNAEERHASLDYFGATRQMTFEFEATDEGCCLQEQESVTVSRLHGGSACRIDANEDWLELGSLPCVNTKKSVDWIDNTKKSVDWIDTRRTSIGSTNQRRRDGDAVGKEVR